MYDDELVPGIVFYILLALAAALYSAVGQGGGSGYLAVMAYFGIAPEQMKPAALTLNVVVTTVVVYQTLRAGTLQWSLLWPFLATSVPAAFIGGTIQLQHVWYQIIVGLSLIVAGVRLLWGPTQRNAQPPPVAGALLTGAVFGIVSGLTGVGGGLFLSPFLIYMGWCTMQQNIALSAAFIWFNSSAALAGLFFVAQPWPPGLPLMVVAVLAGTLAARLVTARYQSTSGLQRVLGVVLIIAAFKFLLV